MGSAIKERLRAAGDPDQGTAKLKGLNENGAAAMTGTDFLRET
jgi:hypothetical protein